LPLLEPASRRSLEVEYNTSDTGHLAVKKKKPFAGGFFS
jgi:hypothetical protein